jgi:hypothetical protein
MLLNLTKANRTPVCLRMLLAITLLLAMVFGGCNVAETKSNMTEPARNDKSKTKPFLITIQKIFEWEPGLPRIIHQAVLDGQGSGQLFELEDKKIVKLKTIANAENISKQINIDDYFNLKDRYEKPVPPGLIVEGNALIYKFIFFDYTKKELKIIDCESDRMPDSLLKLEELMSSLDSSSDDAAEQGLHLMARPLGKHGSEEVLSNASVNKVGPDALNRILVLKYALSRPTTLIKVEDDQYSQLQAYFQLENLIKKRGLFVLGDWGVVKLEFFER